MKLYEFDYWERRGITCYEIEVEKETEKCYFTKRHSRISKEDINTLTRYGRMICLSSDDTIFRNALIERYTNEIERCKEDISRYEKNIEQIRGCK